MKRSESGYKLLLSYDVSVENMQEYYHFVLARYVPVMQALGLEMRDAWQTAYGSFPNRLIGFVTRDSAPMEHLLDNETWAALNEELSRHVSDIDYKVVRYREGFQCGDWRLENWRLEIGELEIDFCHELHEFYELGDGGALKHQLQTKKYLRPSASPAPGHPASGHLR